MVLASISLKWSDLFENESDTHLYKQAEYGYYNYIFLQEDAYTKLY